MWIREGEHITKFVFSGDLGVRNSDSQSPETVDERII
jgi:hypothetical protein